MNGGLNKSTLIVRRLYRSLLKAAQPFTRQQPGYPFPAVLNCLLHRTGHEDPRNWTDFLRAKEANDDVLDDEFGSKDRNAEALFLKLLKQTVTGSPTGTGLRQMQTPGTVDCTRLSNIIRQEFRRPLTMLSPDDDMSVRRQVAFRALRELHKKLRFAETLMARQSSRTVDQSQLQENVVHPLPLRPSSSYLRPGAFLLAHPLLTGYFRRSVICILDHVAECDSDAEADDPPDTSKAYGTYGLVINRLGTTSMTMAPLNARSLTLPDVLTPLPDMLAKSPLATLPLREGGPVHFSLQMLYGANADEYAEWKFGGAVLPSIAVDDQQSTAIATDRAVYYRGSLVKVARALQQQQQQQEAGKNLTDSVALFIGCSTWSEGQLEREVEQGCWLPCAAPATVALTGSLAWADGSGLLDNEHDSTTSSPPQQIKQQQPPATPDLWLSLMSSLGEEERQLAYLLQEGDWNDENGVPCDDETVHD